MISVPVEYFSLLSSVILKAAFQRNARIDWFSRSKSFSKADN